MEGVSKSLLRTHVMLNKARFKQKQQQQKPTHIITAENALCGMGRNLRSVVYMFSA